MLNNVPRTGQSLGYTQPLINANFVTWIDAGFSTNHVSFMDGLNLQGLHNFIQLPSVHTTYPLLPTNGLNGQVGLYSAPGPVSTNPELFFQRTGLTAGNGYSITEYNTGNTYTFASGSGNITMNYTWTRLPSGILMLWADQTTNGPKIDAGGLNILFPTFPATTFPGFSTKVFNVQVTTQNNTTAAPVVANPVEVVKGSYASQVLKFQVTIAFNTSYEATGSISYFAVGI